jgi:hypothetical protein
LRGLQDVYEPERANPVRLQEAGNPSRGGLFIEGVQALFRNIFAGIALPGVAQPRRKGFRWFRQVL